MEDLNQNKVNMNTKKLKENLQQNTDKYIMIPKEEFVKEISNMKHYKMMTL